MLSPHCIYPSPLLKPQQLPVSSPAFPSSPLPPPSSSSSSPCRATPNPLPIPISHNRSHLDSPSDQIVTSLKVRRQTTRELVLVCASKMTEMTTPWAGDAMDTLKMKIGLITKESKESSTKMEKAEKVRFYISYSFAFVSILCSWAFVAGVHVWERVIIHKGAWCWPGSDDFTTFFSTMTFWRNSKNELANLFCNSMQFSGFEHFSIRLR